MVLLIAATITIISWVLTVKKLKKNKTSRLTVAEQVSILITFMLTITTPWVLALPMYTGQPTLVEKQNLAEITTNQENTWGIITNKNQVAFLIAKKNGKNQWVEPRTTSTKSEVKIFQQKIRQPYYTLTQKWDKSFLIVPWEYLTPMSDTYNFYVPENSIIYL